MSRLFFVCWVMLIIAKTGVAGFTCPGVGDFPDPSDCMVIHKCKSRGAESNDFLCPPGTIFDQKCVWPHATRRRCDSGESEVSSKMGIVCESAGEIPDPNNCRMVHICMNAGEPAIRMSCRPGLVYDGLCVPPDQSSRDCKPDVKGDQDEGEIASRQGSLFKADPKFLRVGKPVEASNTEDSTNEVNFNATDEVTPGEGATEINVSLTESHLNAENIESDAKVVTMTKRKSLFAGSRGFSLTDTGTIDVTGLSDPTSESPSPDILNAAKALFAGNVSPRNGSVMDQKTEDAAKDLPAMEAMGHSDENAYLPDDGFQDRIQSDIEPSNDKTEIALTENEWGDYRKCLDRLYAAVSVTFERLQQKVQSARREGSRILEDISTTVDTHVSGARAFVNDGLEQKKTEINQVIEQRKSEVTEILERGVKSVRTTIDAVKSVIMGAVEISLGLASGVVKTGKCLTTELLGLGQTAKGNVNYAGRGPTEEVAVFARRLPTPAPREFNNILRNISSRMRSLADYIDSYSRV